ncbi:hypothetical protein PIB30_059932 [Stylosanthes scabra]|uniref:Uncharacterized protein n=1 Tax=Stylosanthes scabra TaxID=79078 RepID=A0ABU6VLD9_9FABA|nr:hypothetical protein [Stylosanthes scabra]
MKYGFINEFRRTELIPLEKPITARLMETTRLGRNVQAQPQQNDEEEDQPMPQFEGGNAEDHDQGQHQHFQQQFQQPEAGFQQNYWEQQQEGFHHINEQLASMQLQQQQFFENMQSTQAQYLEELKTVKARQDELWNNTNKFHHQIRKEQDMIAREIQEVKNQANPNLTEIPIHQIPDLIQGNAENGRHIFHGALKSQLVAGSSSQAPPPQPADEPMVDPRN